MKYRRGAIVQDAGVIGWISISEVFLLCGVTMLAVALGVQFNLDRTRGELVEIKKDGDIPALKHAIDELKEARKLDGRKIDDLTDRLAASDLRASKLAEGVAKLRDELRIADSERAKLREDLATLSRERDRLAADLMARDAELASSRSENDALRRGNLALELEIRRLEGRLAQIDEAIVMPLKAAKLIVKVRCARPPAGYDLDLFVQDPHNKICSWLLPRTLFEDRETGLMILSEDLRNPKNAAEEIYYSLTIEPSDSQNPYLIFCMLYDKSGHAQPVPLDVKVHWEVSMDLNGGLKLIREGDRSIDQPGQVLFANGEYSYTGLFALASFQRPSTPDERAQVLDHEQMPEWFRGFSRGGQGVGGRRVIKSRSEQ
jgi:hypothetical protein